MEAVSTRTLPQLRIGAHLLATGLITAEQLADALDEKERTGARIGEIVVRKGWVSAEALARTLARQSGLEYCDIESTEREGRATDLLSPKLARYFRCIPVRVLDDRTVLVAVADPWSPLLEDLPSAMGYDVRITVASEDAIDRIVDELDPTGVGGPPMPPLDPVQPVLRLAPNAEPLSPGGGEEDEASPEGDDADEAHLAAVPDPAPGVDEPGADGTPLLSVVPADDPASEAAAEPSMDEPEPAPEAAAARTQSTAATDEAIHAAGEEAELDTAPHADAPHSAAVQHDDMTWADAEEPAPAQPVSEEIEPAPESQPAFQTERAFELQPAFGADASFEPEPALETGAETDVEPEAALPSVSTESGDAGWDGAELPFAADDSPPAPAGTADWTEPTADEPPVHESAPEAPRDDAREPEPEATHAEPASELDAWHGIAPGTAEPTVTEEAGEGVGSEWARADHEASFGADTAVVDTGAAEPPEAPAVDDGDGAEPAVDIPPVSAADDAGSLADGVAEEPATGLVPRFAVRPPQLGMMLLQAGLLSGDQLAEALAEREESDERLGAIVTARGWVSERALAQAIADQYHLPFIDLDAAPPNMAVATLLPERYARRYEAVPTRFVHAETLLVAVADPTNVLANDELRLVLGKGIELAVATRSAVLAAIERTYPGSDGGEPESQELEVEEPGRDAHVVDVLDASESGPAVDLVNEVVRRAIQEGASDIHFEPREDRLVVRMRVDGVMHELRSAPTDLKQPVAARLKVMGELDIAERRAPQDGGVTVHFGGSPVDLRIAVLPTIHGEQTVIRILHRTVRTVEFSELGLAGDTAAVLRHAIAQPYGIVLSVGPTGSGKTTTLYAALGLLNSADRCLMTVEDPVEYQLDGVNQIQVNPRAGLTFAAGLQTILRSDPDVLLVGEIRDSETARIAIQAAMTGHLVLSTLHADNVGSAVSRLVDMGVERQLLASSLNCVLAQRLARRLCSTCRVPIEMNAEELVQAGADPAAVPEGTVTLYAPAGCSQCHGGFKGRVGLFEALPATPATRRLVETATAEVIYERAVAGGMRPLHADGLRLCIDGLTSLDEIRRVAGERRT